MPEEFVPIRELMAADGVEASKINMVLQINAQKQRILISWTYQDVLHQFEATSEELLLDA